jgi:hypothetical protein
MPLYNYTPNPFWYMQNLPISYWFGLSLTVLTLVWYLTWANTNNSKIDVSYVILFALYLFGTLDFATSNSYFMDIYARVGQIDAIAKLGTISTPVLSGHADTPGPYIFFAMFKLVAGDKVFDTLVRFYNVFVLTVLSVFVYIVARRLPISGKALMAPIAFLSFACFLEFHIDRQTFGLVMFSILLFSTLELLKSSKVQWSLIFIVASISLAFSHPGTPVFFLSGLIFAIFLTYLPWFRSRMTVRRRNLLFLFLSNLIIYLTWYVSFSDAYYWFKQYTLFILSSFINALIGRVNVTPTAIQNPSQSFETVIVIREMQIFLLLLVGILSVIYLFSKKSWNYRALFLAGLFASSLFLMFLLFAGHAYVERGFLFMLFPISILCAFVFETSIKRAWAKRNIFSWVILAILIFSMILLPITSYGGNLPFECPSSSEISCANFVLKYSPNRTYVTGMRHSGLLTDRLLLGSLEGNAWSGQTISQLPDNATLLILNADYYFWSLRYGSSKEYGNLESDALTSGDRICDTGLGRLYELVKHP